jgi:Effector-associated domain 2
MFEAALVAWIVGVLGDKTLKGLRTIVLGKPERQALAVAMDIACRSLLEDVPPEARESLGQMLADCFSEPPAAVRDGRVSVKDALIQGLQAKISPLADPSITSTGRSRLDQLGVDGSRLIAEIPGTIIRSIQQVGPSYPVLQPLIAQLNADSVQERVDQILDMVQAQVLPSPGGPREGTLTGTGWNACPAPRRGALDPMIDAILGVPSMGDYGARMAIINTLPPMIRDAIPRNAIARVDIMNTIQTCENYSGGLRELVSAIRTIERDSKAMANLDATILALDADAAGMCRDEKEAAC